MTPWMLISPETIEVQLDDHNLHFCLQADGSLSPSIESIPQRTHLYFYSSNRIPEDHTLSVIEQLKKHDHVWNLACLDFPFSTQTALQLQPSASEQASLIYFSSNRPGNIINCWKQELHPLSKATLRYVHQCYPHVAYQHSCIHLLQHDQVDHWTLHHPQCNDLRELSNVRRLLALSLGQDDEDSMEISGAEYIMAQNNVTTSPCTYEDFRHYATNYLRSELPWGHLSIPTMSTPF